MKVQYFLHKKLTMDNFGKIEKKTLLNRENYDFNRENYVFFDNYITNLIF